jgi:hypothetical protein
MQHERAGSFDDTLSGDNMSKIMSAPAGAASVAVPSEAQIVAKVAWRIMPLIMVCYLFAFFDSINISFA